MPSLWKKMKNNRISKLVNDHLQSSQKRRDGSSLVVETGFPTSLIDFYIKNREKLKKPSKKRRQSPPVKAAAEEDVGNDQVMSCPITYLPSPLGPPSPPANTPLHCCSSSPLQSPPLILPLPSDVDVNEIVLVSGDVSEVAGDEKEGYGEMVVDGKIYRVFSMVLKMFLVVILVLGTKRLAVGVTISAFFLFFLDYMSRNVGRCLRHCVEAKSLLRLLTVEKVLRLLRFKEEDRLIENKSGVSRMEIDEDEFVRPRGSSPLMSSESRYDHVKEIEDVAAKESSVGSHVDEIKSENKIVEDSRFIDRLEYSVEVDQKNIVSEEEESLCEGFEVKRKKIISATNIKSKMKKFLVNKLKISGKVHELEKTTILAKDKGVLIQALEPSQVHVDREESGSARRFSSCWTLTQKEEDNMIPPRAFSPVSEVNEQQIAMNQREGAKMQNGPSFRYLAMLCLMILIGLVQSRVIAVVLASSCCLLMKLREHPRYKDLSFG